MPGSGTAEVYFVTAMMLLTFLLSGVSVYFFITTYKKEMKEKAKRDEAKAAKKKLAEAAETER